ncbi:PRC-barrel domain containing protein [Rhodobacterales bacterium HKCCE3408]|nr:PRC-barrel domain containing protein [Rhodobacterales bacterium HKCCE3408]
MLVSSNDLRQFAIKATDGRTGHVEDFYFDDNSWNVRYVVTRSGFLFTERQGLLKSTLLGMPDLERREVPVSVDKDQVETAEDPDADPPVSEQRNRDAMKYRFDLWPPLMLGVPGAVFTPEQAEHQLYGGPAAERDIEKRSEDPGDPNLRSVNEIAGYGIDASDGEIGSIVDVILDPEGWRVTHLVADTGTWLPGRQVVLPTDWIRAVSWAERNIIVNVSTEKVKNATELDTLEELRQTEPVMAFAPYGAYGAYAGLPI